MQCWNIILKPMAKRGANEEMSHSEYFFKRIALIGINNITIGSLIRQHAMIN